MNAGLRCLLLALLAPMMRLGAVEIATGSMLGPRYEGSSFYQRLSPRGDWSQTYQGGPFRRQARGKLLGVRATYAVFEDEWLNDPGFDADANTSALTAALERYQRYGVNVIAVNLQGGATPYAGSDARTGQARDGKEKGALISAFAPDGALVPAWTKRLETLLTAANKAGIVVMLTYFTPDQDEVFESPEAIVAAARNMTRWLIERDARNVIIDVADRWDLESEIWDFGRFVPRNIGSLVIDIRDQFNSAAFTLPIGATGGNAMSYPSSLAKLCDLILVRGDPASGAAQRATRWTTSMRWIGGAAVRTRPGRFGGGRGLLRPGGLTAFPVRLWRRGGRPDVPAAAPAHRRDRAPQTAPVAFASGRRPPRRLLRC